MFLITQTNPLGFRQMTEEELLLLTINQSALRSRDMGLLLLRHKVMEVLECYRQDGQPTQEQAQLVLDAVNGIDDQDALDASE